MSHRPGISNCESKRLLIGTPNLLPQLSGPGPISGNLPRKWFGNRPRRLRQPTCTPHPQAQFTQFPGVPLPQGQLVTHSYLGLALLLVATQPCCLGTCYGHGCDSLKFSRGQRQGTGFIKHCSASWIATPYQDSAEDCQGRDPGHHRESSVLKHARGLPCGVIPASLLKAGTGLIPLHIGSPGI